MEGEVNLKEPNVSQIEKLIEHFRSTGREKELTEALGELGIINDPTQVIDPITNEFNEQAYLFKKKSQGKSFFEILTSYYEKHKPFLKKWYVRYLLNYLLIFLGAFTILNAPMVFSRLSRVDNSKSKIIRVQETESTKNEQSAPLDFGEVVPAQSQLVIPKINVSAPVLFPSDNSEKNILETLKYGTAHYPGTSTPGEVGNTFITGHSSNFWWIKGNYNYIFVNLDKLKIGDQAKIYHGGNKYVYEVTEKLVVEPTNTSVLAQGDTPKLTLMTCTPPGTNWRRLIIIFDQIAPEYHKQKKVIKEKLVAPEELPSTDSNAGGMIGDLWAQIKKLFSLSN